MPMRAPFPEGARTGGASCAVQVGELVRFQLSATQRASQAGVVQRFMDIACQESALC